MKKYIIGMAAGVLLVSACRDSSVVAPNRDSPTAAQLTGQLNRTSLQTLAIGLLSADRNTFVGSGSTYPILAEIYARDIYRLDPSEGRYLGETILNPPDPGSFAGGGGWAGMYVTIRQANTLLQALDNPAEGVFSDAELSAVTGFAQTYKAIAYYRVLELRDTIGVALQGDDPNAVTTPAPIVCKKNMLAYVAALLDSANTNLAAAGNIKFPWGSFPSGMTAFGRDYRQVSNFILFNRAWKGKVDFYRGIDHQNPTPALFTQSIAELTQALGGAAPGAVPASQFKTGMYYVFIPAGSEAAPNPFSDRRIGINPALDSVRAGDTRASKIVTRATATIQGVTLTKTLVNAVSNAANQAAPLAVIRDEELVLLRAQAEFEAGQFVQGYADLNSVHTSYALAAYPVSVALNQARSDLLYDKRYSLLGEGVQRLVDLRAYARLNAINYPKQTLTDAYNSAFPIPKAEFDARNGDVTPSCT